jgi:HEAT repeat protein
MAVTMNEVIEKLNVDEPNYPDAAALGPDALPHLNQLVAGPDVMLASKAAYLAGLIADARALPVMEAAARSVHPVVRVAAAAALGQHAQSTPDLFRQLLPDPDPGVRKAALRSLERRKPAGLRPEVQKIVDGDPEPALKDLARRVMPALR